MFREWVFSTPCTASMIRRSSGDASIVTLTTFMDSVLPPLSTDIDLDALVRNLKRVRAPTRQIITKNGHLWGYSRRIPSQLEHARVFSYIESCAARLRRRFPSKDATFCFQNDANFALCNSESFPAAYFYAPPTDMSSTLDWTRIAVSGAYMVQISPYSCSTVSITHSRHKTSTHTLMT